MNKEHVNNLKMDKEKTNKIGDRGDSLNFSMASRSPHITPDLERLAKYDDYPVRIRKLKFKNLSWFLLFAVVAAKLILMGYVWWAIIPGILALRSLYWFFAYHNTTPHAIYENGLLCAGIIVSENPLRIAVMSDMTTKPDTPVCWGVKCFDVKGLPSCEIAIGEHVPCAVMFGGAMPFAGVWSKMDPHPICWATDDASLLEEAEQAIDESEWKTLNVLAKLAAARDDVDYSEEIAYFNEDLSARIDLQEKPAETVATASEDELLLEHVLWRFCGGKYDSQEKFVDELVKFNHQSGNGKIDPAEIVVENEEIIILYAYEDKDNDYAEEFNLKADNNTGFTTGELLYKVHNQTVIHLQDLSYHIFDGLADNGKHEEYPDIPFYYLNLRVDSIPSVE